MSLLNDRARVDIWRGLVLEGASALTEQAFQMLELKLGVIDRLTLRALLDSVAADKKWVLDRTRQIRDETERIERVGLVMRRAGLRSYTDRDGNVFVSEQYQP